MDFLKRVFYVVIVLTCGAAVAATANMAMNLPTVGSTPGPTWASMLNAALTTIDQHDHSPGKGVRIGSPGINIQTTLELNSNTLSEIKSLRLDAQSEALTGAGDLRSIYAVGDDLWYNNGSGQSIQLTSGGGINLTVLGGFGGDYSTAGASAIYTDATKLYTFRQPDLTNANLLARDVTLQDATPALVFNDTTTNHDDFQVVADSSVLSINADTDNNGSYDAVGLLRVDASSSAVGVGASPVSVGTGYPYLTVTRTSSRPGLAVVAATSQDADIVFNRPSNSANQRIVQEVLTSNGIFEIKSLTDAGNTIATILHADVTTGNVSFGTIPSDLTPMVSVSDTRSDTLRITTADRFLPNTPATLLARRSRGDPSAPGAVLSGDWLGGIDIGGYDGTAWTKGSNGGARIIAYTSEGWTSSAHGTSLSFKTTNSGSTSDSEKMVLTHDGKLGLGVSSPSFTMTVAGDVGPEADGTRDLGSSAKAWNNAYVGTVNATTVNASTVSSNSVSATTFVSSQDAGYTIPLTTRTFQFFPSCGAARAASSCINFGYDGSIRIDGASSFSWVDIPLPLPSSGSITAWRVKVRSSASSLLRASAALYRKAYATGIQTSATIVGAAAITVAANTDVELSQSVAATPLGTNSFFLRVTPGSDGEVDVGMVQVDVSSNSYPVYWR